MADPVKCITSTDPFGSWFQMSVYSNTIGKLCTFAVPSDAALLHLGRALLMTLYGHHSTLHSCFSTAWVVHDSKLMLVLRQTVLCSLPRLMNSTI